jgi:hypothetical protein
MNIEQAIFTSAQTEAASGYHLVCRSPGIVDADQRALVAWGPSHDALVSRTEDASSINFFPLPSRAYCISRTVTSGMESSDRGGWRVYTHCLIMSPAELARFANNPFAIIRAALAAGVLDMHDELPKQLEPVRFGGRAAEVDYTLLYRMSNLVAPEDLVRMAAIVCENQQTAIVTPFDGALIAAAIINTLPADRRRQLSFCTGLRFSLQRPFRLIVLPSSASKDISHAEQSSATIVDLNQFSSRIAVHA